MEGDLHIVRRGDPPPWNDDPDKIVHPLNPVWDVAILEGGTQAGKPSVALRVPLPDERVLIVETSLAIYAQVVIAGRAAFPEVFAGGPLDVSGPSESKAERAARVALYAIELQDGPGFWFFALCADCEPLAEQRFKFVGERDAWAHAHHQATGHSVVTVQSSQ